MRVFCSGYKPKDYKKQDSDLSLSYLNDELLKQNIDLKFEDLKQYIISRDDYAFDLLVIAIYVYIADRRSYRGDLYSIFDPKWNQEFEFYIPVSKPNFWKQKHIKESLEEVFHFTIGHNYTFHFVKDEKKTNNSFFKTFNKTKLNSCSVIVYRSFQVVLIL